MNMDKYGKQLRASIYLNEDVAQIVEINRKKEKMSLSGYLSGIITKTLMPEKEEVV